MELLETEIELSSPKDYAEREITTKNINKHTEETSTEETSTKESYTEESYTEETSKTNSLETISITNEDSIQKLSDNIIIKNRIITLSDSIRKMIKFLKIKSFMLHYSHVLLLVSSIFFTTVAGILTIVNTKETIYTSMVLSFLTASILTFLSTFDPDDKSGKLIKIKGKLENIILKLEDPTNEYKSNKKLNHIYKKYSKKVIKLNIKTFSASNNSNSFSYSFS